MRHPVLLPRSVTPLAVMRGVFGTCQISKRNKADNVIIKVLLSSAVIHCPPQVRAWWRDLDQHNNKLRDLLSWAVEGNFLRRDKWVWIHLDVAGEDHAHQPLLLRSDLEQLLSSLLIGNHNNHLHWFQGNFWEFWFNNSHNMFCEVCTVFSVPLSVYRSVSRCSVTALNFF